MVGNLVGVPIIRIIVPGGGFNVGVPLVCSETFQQVHAGLKEADVASLTIGHSLIFLARCPSHYN